MNLEEAKIVSDKMTYSDAVYNALCSKCVPYRKATRIKLKELLEIAKSVDGAKAKGCNEISTALYCDGFNDGYSNALDDLRNELKNHYTESNVDWLLDGTEHHSYLEACNYLEDYIDEMTEKLKRGGEDA